MKKVFLIAGAVLLLAAACNSKVSTTEGGKVDTAVNSLNASVDSEQSANLQSDDNIINSDQSVISNYQGAVNENSY
ncbi:MAG TPA: hypothetical protein VGQ87_01325 [Patescibacteria group bacterium]|jgi:hypothetical protein|nr:hypothetical protein [Patescibacteria group bacterium]